MREKIIFAYSKERVNTPTPGKNQRVTLDQLHTLLTAGIYPAAYDQLPDLARRARAGDNAAAALLSERKKELPYFLASGFCPTHHNDATLEYNGVLQIDIDFKQLAGVLLALAALELISANKPAGVLLAGLSPSTYGVKLLLLTDNLDKEKHRAAFEYVRAILSEGLQISPANFDVLGASQPCYMFYQRPGTALYYNPDATPVHIPTTAQNPAQVKRSAPTQIDAETLEQIKQAADYLIKNRCNVATCYDEYLQIMFAVKHTFGADGEAPALELLNNCPTFATSTTRSTFSRRWDKLKPQKITGRYLLYIAGKFGFTGRKTPPQRTFDLQAGEYLTDAIKRHRIDPESLTGKYIIAPTGAGKTHFAAELSKHKPVVVILPTTAQVEQIAARNGATPWHGNARNIPENCRFIASTLQSFPQLLTRLNATDWHVLFDEAHGFTTDSAAGYKLEDLRRFLELRRRFCLKVTYMTGTDIYNYHPDFSELERVIFKREKDGQREKTLYIQRCQNIAATVAQYARESVAAGRIPFILLNDKYLKLAALDNALEGFKVAKINADTKHTADVKQITETGEIPADAEILISTTVIREGTDINDRRPFDFYIIGHHHSTTIEQISARARTSTDVAVYVFKKAENADTRDFDADRYAEYCTKAAQRFCDEHNARTKYDSTESLFFELQLRKAMQQVGAYQPDNSTTWSICHLAINNAVYQAETTAQYRCDALQIKALEQYGFKYLETIHDRVNDQHSAETTAAISAAQKATKQAKQNKYDADLEALETAIFPVQMIEQAKRAGNMPDAYKHVTRLQQDFAMPIHTAAAALRRENPKGSGKGFKLMYTRQCAAMLRNDDRYLQSGRIMSLIMLQLDKLIQPGQPYTADELREILRRCLQLDKSINTDKLLPLDEPQKANRKALELLRYFYTDTEKRGAAAAECPRKRVFYLELYTIFADKTTHAEPAKAETKLRRIFAATIS